jgi:hypothetical protein
MIARYLPVDESRGVYGYSAQFALEDVVAVDRSHSRVSSDWCVVHLRGGPSYEFHAEEGSRFLREYDAFLANREAR